MMKNLPALKHPCIMVLSQNKEKNRQMGKFFFDWQVKVFICLSLCTAYFHEKRIIGSLSVNGGMVSLY